MKIRLPITLLLLMIAVFARSAAAQTTAFTYQGKLSDGTMAASGNYDLSFALYDAETDGNQIGLPLTRPNVSVSNGIFTVQLDFSANPFVSGANRFLQIAVKKTTETNYTTLTPRQQLTASPYSIRTLSATAADSLSSACVGCVSNNQINAIDGAKITGTITNATAASADRANTANEARTALTAGNVTGIVAIANGGTGSATKNFADLTTDQTVAGDKTFSGNLRFTGLFRSGSEANGAFPVTYTSDGIEVYSGLVVRRISSLVSDAGRVVARTDNVTLERDGTNGGLRVSYTSSGRRSINCLGINSNGEVVAASKNIPTNAFGTIAVYSDAQSIIFVQCSFGNSFNAGHMTQFTLQRAANDYFWIGNLTSTFNQ